MTNHKPFLHCEGFSPAHPPPSVCVVLALPLLSDRSPGYGLVQEELLSPASMQYSLPSPLGVEPYWQEVSSLEFAPLLANILV